MDSAPLADVMAQVARELDTPQELEEALDTIVRTAARSLPGLDHAGVSTAYSDGRIVTEAGTDPLVWQLDELQYTLREGPCVHSLEHGPVTTVDDVAHDPRWPRYGPRAAELGVRSQMGIKLYTDQTTLGVLNLYAMGEDRIDPDLVHTAELFATHASLALGRARQAHHLTEALATRRSIGQAIGLVMERYRLDEDVAFQYLVRVSNTSNLKLRDVAQEIIDLANADYARGGRAGGASGPGLAGVVTTQDAPAPEDRS